MKQVSFSIVLASILFLSLTGFENKQDSSVAGGTEFPFGEGLQQAGCRLDVQRTFSRPHRCGFQEVMIGSRIVSPTVIEVDCARLTLRCD